jgi:single-strand DNA-binding protein
MGRMTKEPELRQTQSGVSVCRFTLAVNRRFAKEGQMTADFINCTAWRQQADFISKYFHKGNMIAVVGSLNTNSWEGQDGKKQYSTDVLVDEAYFTGSKESSSSPAPQDSFGGFDGFKEMDATGDSFPWEN